MNKKRIMVVCGSAVATSVAMKQFLKEELEKRNLEVEIDTISVNEATTRVDAYDLVILLTKMKLETEKPIFSGIPFLTGVGLEDLLKKIVNHISS